MTKGEKASVSILHTTIIPQKHKCLRSAATVIAQSRGIQESEQQRVGKKEQWHVFKMLPCTVSYCWHQVQAQVGTPHPDCLSWPIV